MTGPAVYLPHLPDWSKKISRERARQNARFRDDQSQSRATGERDTNDNPRRVPSGLPDIEPQAVAGGVVEVLADAQVTFGRLNRGVAQRELRKPLFP